MEINRIYNEDCLIGMRKIPDANIDVILTDPPYLYLKNQKLDKPFDEDTLFSEWKRVLKKGGFVILFGRGTSFYRWNYKLSELGFDFKEEIIWDKGYCTSPLMPISRVHETVSIFTKGKGKINKVKVPYLEMKGNDVDGIIQDVKRMRSILKNPKSLNAVLNFLEMNKVQYDGICEANHTSVSGDSSSIVNNYECAHTSKYLVTSGPIKDMDRCAAVMKQFEFGMNEKDIIKATRDHYTAIHPTQKPTRLLERLLNLVCGSGALVLDCFSGSGSTAIACINTNRRFIGFEIDKEYYDASCNRIDKSLGLFK